MIIRGLKLQINKDMIKLHKNVFDIKVCSMSVNGLFVFQTSNRNVDHT